MTTDDDIVDVRVGPVRYRSSPGNIVLNGPGFMVWVVWFADYKSLEITLGDY